MNPNARHLPTLLGLLLVLSACNRGDQTQVGKAAPLPAAEALGLPAPVTQPPSAVPAAAAADAHAPEPLASGPAPLAPAVAPIAPAAPTINPEQLNKLDERLKQTETSLSWLQDSFREMQQQVNILVVQQQKRDAERLAQQSAPSEEAPPAPAKPKRAKAKVEPPVTAAPAVAETPVPASPPTPMADVAPLTPRPAPYSDVYPTLPTTRSERPATPTDRVSPARPRRAPSLPFSIEAVDHWGDEIRIVVKEKHGEPHDVLPGQKVAGWTLESADGQTVTVRDAKGRRYSAHSAWQADAR